MLEHIITDTFKHTLTDINHHSGINKCGNHTKCKNTAKDYKCLIEFCKVRICLSDQRDDKVIQQKFQGQGYCNTCCGTDKDADQIIVLDDGKIAGVGTSEELLKTNDIYREVYESQVKGGGDDE